MATNQVLFSWDFRDFSMLLQWCFRGASLVLPWKFHGYPMVLRGPNLGFWDFHGLPLSQCTSMEAWCLEAWLPHGASMEA